MRARAPRCLVPEWAAACTDMGSLAELFATGEPQTLEFFFLRLKDVSEPTVDRQELLYNASVLAHYAQVSTQSIADLATPATLAEVFDHFVFDTSLRHDSVMMEAAGAQCLLLAGFFQDQMCHRHNIRWYANLGAGFFTRRPLWNDRRRKRVCSPPSLRASSPGGSGTPD